jgi:hypothetical protein
MKTDTVLKDFCFALRDEMKTDLTGYLGICNHYLVTLDLLIEEINKIIIFSRRFSDSKYYESNNINLSDYVNYHFEVYLHKIHTILDIMRLTINHAYNLQLEERDCSWKNIKDRGISGKVRDIITSYYLYFKPIINLRHANTHKAKNVNTLFTKYSGYLELKKRYKKANLEFPQELKELVPELVLNFKLRQYRKEKISNITEGKEKAREYIDSFSYEIQKEALKKYNNGRLEKT